MSKMEKFSLNATQWIGTPLSLIIHSIFFSGIFILRFFSVKTEDILLWLTTIVSLEAIYLSIFIQMTVNRQSVKLDEVQEELAEVQEDIDEVQENMIELVDEDKNS